MTKETVEYGWELLAKCTSEMIKDLGLKQPYEKYLWGNVWDYLENDKNDPLPPAFFQFVQSFHGSESTYLQSYNRDNEQIFNRPWCIHQIEVPYHDPFLKIKGVELWCTKYGELCWFRRFIENDECYEPRIA